LPGPDGKNDGYDFKGMRLEGYDNVRKKFTQDLAGFWREQYPKVKQELQRKYPKHEWR
jgi:hypothetical protein